LNKNIKYINKVIQGDCLEVMPNIPDKSIDMILCDLPYGTTACKWDTIIPFEPLWKEYKRIIKDNGAIVLTASQPFTSALVMSNIKMFKYELIWDKVLSTGHLNSKIIPLKRHEDILIFSKSKNNYNPIMVNREKTRINKSNGKEFHGDGLHTYGKFKSINATYYQRFPTSIIEISNANKTNIKHPTQKPVALFEYLIKTYTNEGDLVLDNCAGSFTTAIAAENLKRDWICIEKEKSYCNIGWKRINENRIKLNSDLFGEFNLPLLDNCDIL